jgi:hypothetical protein
METLSKMFNAMEQRYVSYALDEYKDSNPASAEDGTSLVEDVLKADDADSKVNVFFITSTYFYRFFIASVLKLITIIFPCYCNLM